MSTTRDQAPRLGRGLAALFGDAPAGADPGAPVQELDVAALDPGRFQPRAEMEPEALAELVRSVRASGVLQPILVRPHPERARRYEIIAGERRWRAAREAGLARIPALIRPFTDPEAMAAALVENLQRQDLNAIEEAEGYRRLMGEFGLTQERLGDAVGKSRSHVANTLRLLNLPDTVRGELRRGTLTAGHARALLAHADPARAALQVIARGLNVRQTEALVRPPAEAPERRRRAPRDPDAEAVGRELTERLGLRVEVSFDGRGGTVRIHYRDLDQLDGVIALLRRD